MSGAHHIYSGRERLVHLISLALDHEYINANHISKYFDCTRRTADRLIELIYNMRHELIYLKISLKSRPKRLRIRLNDLFLYN